MADQTFLLCPGATKAGTSWLYRWLSGHPDCHFKAVKELHYFSSFDEGERAKKVSVFEGQIERFECERDQAAANGQGWKVDNMTRRIDDMRGLIACLQADRSDDAAYVHYLNNGADQARVVGDISPSYAVLSDANVARVAKLPFDVRVIYLVRDPLERLWSHVRMHAQRFLREGQEVVSKSSAVLWRILHKGHETHITERGDYVGTIAKYHAVFGERFKVVFAENLSNADTQRDICASLGVPFHAPENSGRTHEGMAIPFPEKHRRKTVEFLRDQYDFIANTYGPVPQNWTQNRELIS